MSKFQVKIDPISGAGVVKSPFAVATIGISGYKSKAGKSNSSLPAAQRSEESFQKAPDDTPFVPWGDANDWPQLADGIIKSNDLLSRIMEDRRAIHYGQGLQPYQETITAEGKRTIALVNDAEINEWMDVNRINDLYLPASISDFEPFGLIFPQLVLSANRKKISRIYHQPTSSIRWGLQDKKTLLTPKVYLCHFWNDDPSPEDWIEIPALDPYNPMEDIEARAKEFSFIFPCSLPDRVNKYYPMPCWYSAVKMGWVDIANSVPKLKNAIYQNQALIKYHIQIPFDHWYRKYKDWDMYDQDKQVELMENEVSGLMSILSGEDGAGATFVSGYGFNQDNQKEYPGWKITAIDDKLRDGAFIPDSQEAASHILWAGGMDPSIVGVSMPGGKMGAGSGSDKRESYNISEIKLGLSHAITTAPFYFIARYNGWSKRIPNLKWGYRMLDSSQTLDQNPTGKQLLVG